MAYTILVDEAHKHLSLLESLDAMAEWREGGPELDTASGIRAEEVRNRQKTEEELVRQNQKALAELQAMMPDGMRLL